jgi:hypothetical protein
MALRLNVQRRVFTMANVRQALLPSSSRSRAIHFSSHGFRRNDIHRAVRDGDGEVARVETDACLLMERDVRGLDQSGEPLFASDVAALCAGGRVPALVVIMACHSEYVGESFLLAGAQFVVCVKDDFEIADDAAMEFSRQFYPLVFAGVPVEAAFRTAMAAIEALPVVDHVAACLRTL